LASAASSSSDTREENEVPKSPHWKVFPALALVGAMFLPATASAALTALPASDDPSSQVVTIGVILTGDARPGYIPLGDVVFTESDTTLGVVSLGSTACRAGPAPVSCTLRLALAPGYPLGRHTITASYSGDQPRGANPPESLTFSIYVSELAWLPAVLDLLSD
jgi:hypothetical protein